MPASHPPAMVSTHGGSSSGQDRSRQRSKLAGSLRRLHAAIHSNTNDPTRTEDPFAQWQRRWSDYGEQIAQRLTLIDAQLEQFVSNHRQTPQLAVMSEPFCSDVSSLD